MSDINTLQQIDVDWPWSATLRWTRVAAACPQAMTLLNSLDLPMAARIGVCMENSSELVALIQAAARLGHCLVFFNPRLPDADIEQQVADAALDYCFGKKVDALPSTETVELQDLSPCDDSAIPFPDLETAAAVLQSSGSGGRHKSIRLSLRALLHAADKSCRHLQIGADDCWLLCLPLFHIGGLMQVYRSAASGCGLQVSSVFDAAVINSTLDSGTVHGVSLVPTMLHRLLDQRSSDWSPVLRCLLLGGAALPAAERARCRAFGLNPCASYGMSESTALLAAQQPGHNDTDDCGPLVDGMQVRINNEGLIMLRGAQLFSGYEKEGQLIELRDPAQWFCTSDRGWLDEQGHLHVSGRADDVFVRGGENVALQQVHDAISALQLCDKLALCLVADPEWGQVPALAYVGNIQESELKDICDKDLPALLRPTLVRCLPELPQLSNGKIDRQQLQERFRNDS